MKLEDGERPNTDIEGDQEMETNMAERMHQDDFKWNLDYVEDMCEDEATNLKQTMADYAHHDENTWEELDPKQCREGRERTRLEKFCKMGVYEYVSRAEAKKDETGKSGVQIKWVRTKKGDGVWCTFGGAGAARRTLFARTPSLGSVRVALTHAMKKDTHKVMVMDEKCAFLYGEIQRSVFFELPHTDPRYGDGTLVGKTKEGHVRNTRCATDLGRGRSVNLGSSRIQTECLPARCLLQLGEGRDRSRARR